MKAPQPQPSAASASIPAASLHGSRETPVAAPVGEEEKEDGDEKELTEEEFADKEVADEGDEEEVLEEEETKEEVVVEADEKDEEDEEDEDGGDEELPVSDSI